MFDANFLDDLAKRLSNCVPPALLDAKQDLEKNFRSVLQSTFSKLDLVTREEFDTQTKVLARTREKLDKLEKIVSELESGSAKSKKKPAKKSDPE